MLMMLNQVKNYLKCMVKSEKGQAMVEYGLIIALIAVVVLIAVGLLGDNLKALFNNVATEIPDVLPAD